MVANYKLYTMKKLIVFFLLGFVLIANAQKNEIENRLSKLPDIIFERIKNESDLNPTYKLKIKQPIDHKDHSKGYFYQKVYLTHIGYKRPTVMVTEGYERNWNNQGELSRFLNANQLAVEHRFFGESLPDSLDYNYLNLEQASADLHRIKMLFKDIYKAQWLSTGISKGGATSIFYRYFYPNDVDVSVPYVAPINRAFEDQRIYTFLDTVGSDVCRDKIRMFQEQVLKRRATIKPLLKMYSIGAQGTFTYLSFTEAFEYSVMEYPFSFWQWGSDCNTIPDTNASDEALATHLLKVSDILFFSDQTIENLGPHYYQSAEEMGYYGYETYQFKDLLKALNTKSNPHATFLPNKLTVTFDGTLLKDVNQWLETYANHFIYIYGGSDTWSASAVPPNKKVDSEWFFMKGKHHGSARIANMNTSEKQRLINTLEKWLKLKIE